MTSVLYRCSKCDSRKPLAEFPPSKEKNSGQWCRRCLRDDQRRIKGLIAFDRDVVCRNCGLTFAASDSRAMFCSRICKDLARRAAQSAARRESKPDRSCAWCGDSIPKTMRSDAKFCSAACNEIAHSRTRNFRRRMGPDAPERPRKEPLVRFIDIARRDRWRCKLCGGRVDKARRHPDPLCASLDHIVPVAHAGSNDPSNLQLAHLRCNLSKGSGARGEQLLLL